jgi:hypothetical protein
MESYNEKQITRLTDESKAINIGLRQISMLLLKTNAILTGLSDKILALEVAKRQSKVKKSLKK